MARPEIVQIQLVAGDFCSNSLQNGLPRAGNWFRDPALDLARMWGYSADHEDAS